MDDVSSRTELRPTSHNDRRPRAPQGKRAARDGTVAGRAQSPIRDVARQPFLEAGDGSRTHDLQLGKLTLYQLSYARVEAQLNGSCLGLVGLAHMTGEGGSGS